MVLWEDGVNSKMILEHYGYDHDDKTPARGFWKNDGTSMRRLSQLPKVLKQVCEPNTKIRVIFDYDPNFPRALLQIWGLPKQDINSSLPVCAATGEDG